MKLLMENWRQFLKESKLRVFDFDDTIAKSDSNIHITTGTGEKIKMTTDEYATHKLLILFVMLLMLVLRGER